MKTKVTPRTIRRRLKDPKKLPQNWHFLQDNATTHKSKKSMETVREMDGERLVSHPAKSPDLNAMEDMWSYLTGKLELRESQV
jgi:transposase